MKQFWIQTPTQLAAHLRSLRKVRGLTQKELGDLLGIDQPRMAKIERNPRLISVDQLMKLLSVLRARVLLEPLPEKPERGARAESPQW